MSHQPKAKKKKKEAGSLFPSDLSVRENALFRRCHFIICKSVEGIIFPPESSPSFLVVVELVE